jgi:hypothetical protein
LDDAVAAGGPAAEVAMARDEFAKAEAARSAADAREALKHYKAAWQKAQKAISKA